MSKTSNATKSPAKPRLEVLDQLRGFFIIGIVADHLSRYPSIFALLTGKALLWVTAAEGFVGLSGLLVGYVRGYKNRDLSMKDVSIKLLRRALLLYVWSLISSIVYVAIIWYIPLQGGFQSTPMARGDWLTFLRELLLMHYPYVWVHFLTLYAMFLAVAPIAIWLLRKNLAWVLGLLSFITLALGWYTKAEPLQWQVIFFVPMIIGFYLHSIMEWWHTTTRRLKLSIALPVVSLTAITITISALFTYWSPVNIAIGQHINDIYFAKDSISLPRFIVSSLWFMGYFFVFKALQPLIKKYLNWLLIPIGTHSLTAYILHGLVLCVISFVSFNSGNYLYNSLFGAVAIMAVWGLMKLRFVHKVVPS